jgi:nitrate/nitrite transport system substrate-binding protein
MDDKFSKDGQSKPVSSIKRRDFLKYSIAAVGGAALFSSMPPGMRSAAWAAGTDGVSTALPSLLPGHAPARTVIEHGQRHLLTAGA